VNTLELIAQIVAILAWPACLLFCVWIIARALDDA
jgi:hypothetical protein